MRHICTTCLSEHNDFARLTSGIMRTCDVCGYREIGDLPARIRVLAYCDSFYLPVSKAETGSHPGVNLLPHQQRVVDELTELEKKAFLLVQFVNTNLMFKTLDEDEQVRMRDQCEVMGKYACILRERIAAFKPVMAFYEESYKIVMKARSQGLSELVAGLIPLGKLRP